MWSDVGEFDCILVPFLSNDRKRWQRVANFGTNWLMWQFVPHNKLKLVKLGAGKVLEKLCKQFRYVFRNGNEDVHNVDYKSGA